MASRLWKFLTTDTRELVSLETVDSGKDAAAAVLGLAEVLQTEGPNVQQLAPLVTQLDSLLDVLNSPLGNIVGASLPFVSIATGLLKFYLEKTKKEPTVAQSVALVSQAAYLATVKQFLEQPKYDRWLASKGKLPASDVVKHKLKKLETVELGDTEARRALLHFHESELAAIYNDVLIARFTELGAQPDAAEKVANKLARDTNRLMLQTLVQCSDGVRALVEWYRIGGKTEFEKYLSIDTYLEEVIAPRPHDKVFAEPFSFKDIYVPLKAQPLTSAGEPDETQEPVVLEQWARQMLSDAAAKDRVLFVQGGPGRGKSVFCRMFADWVRCHEHPRWTPILIRLRDVAVLSRDFEETLAKAVDRDFAKTDLGWLSDRNVNFLFILDGFDELLMEGRTSGGLDSFLDQVGRFQEQCARNSEKNHRVLITGRTLALQAIESRMPSNLARIEIESMDNDTQRQWFHRWGKLISKDEADLMQIMQDNRLPERVKELAREPLLLYLLAAMHRDGELRPEMFAGADGAQAKVLIYERTLDWVLTKQRAEVYRREAETQDTVMARDLNPDITELAPEHLRRILQEAGLCVVQSGMEFASIRAIEDRLAQDSAAKAFLEAAQKRLNTDDTPLRNALAAFYLQEGRQGEGSIEFIHKSFGEFLCAERIVNGLIDGCQPGRNREYDIDDPAFCWMMYDLLGCHVLTPEIVEYLTALLVKHPEFAAEKLHKRLYDFYWRWSDGEFIDAPPENLPQQKMRLLKERIPDRQEPLGQRQVDVSAGLSTMILLLELHRYGLSSRSKTIDVIQTTKVQLNSRLEFHPCQFTGVGKFDKHRILRLIGISHCLGLDKFNQRVGPFLSYADLSKSDLSNVNLSGSDLSYANLSDTKMFNSDLSRTDLSGTNLSKSDLFSADLFSASLSHADLNNTNLACADLSNTDLSRTNLSNADLSSTNLSSATITCAILRRADLNGADLSGAYLTGSDLSSANLSHAYAISTYLSDAYLINANLSNANLSNAYLCNASLHGAILHNANLTEASLSETFAPVQWDQDTSWEGVQGLESAIGVPEALKRQLGLE